MGKAIAVKELTPELQNIPSYIAFSKKKNLSAMRDKLDTILLQIRNDGTFDKIMKSYLKWGLTAIKSNGRGIPALQQRRGSATVAFLIRA